MDLLKAFEEIDTDFSGEITKDELMDYMVKKDYETSFVNKWMDLFDPNHSGKITLDEFCDALGLQPNEDYVQQVHSRNVESEPMIAVCPTYGSEYDQSGDVVIDVEIIREDPETDSELRQFAIDISHQAARNHALEKDISREIKTKLDKEYGKMWHVVVSRSTFGSFISHKLAKFMHYKIEEYCYLIWQTPAY